VTTIEELRRQVESLGREILRLEREQRDAKYDAVVDAMSITMEQIQSSKPTSCGGEWHGIAVRFAEWMRSSGVTKRFCEWNEQIYLTDEFPRLLGSPLCNLDAVERAEARRAKGASK